MNSCKLLRLTCWTANADLETDFYLQELVIATSDEKSQMHGGSTAMQAMFLF
jgi:hypothetical protein